MLSLTLQGCAPQECEQLHTNGQLYLTPPSFLVYMQINYSTSPGGCYKVSFYKLI